jgi:hypothetical protein
MRKSQRIAELLDENDKLQREVSELKDSRIRISVPTELGVRPVYDCPLEFAILQNIFAGGNGLTTTGPGEWIHGPVIIELVSQWRPRIEGDYDE